MAARGRPKAADPSERLDIRVPRSVFDALCREALQRRLPAATLAGRILQKYFRAGEKSEQPSSP